MYVTSITQALHDEEPVALEVGLGEAIGRAGENEPTHDSSTAREDRQLFLSVKAALHDLLLALSSVYRVLSL